MRPPKKGDRVTGIDAKGIKFIATVIDKLSLYSYLLSDGKITPVSLIKKVESYETDLGRGRRDHRRETSRGGRVRGGSGPGNK